MTTPQRHYLREPQPYATDLLRQDHNDALYTWGEYAMFALLWTVRDLEAGYVDRCPTCYLAYGKIADAYGQATQEKCPVCYGTTFEGGYRAIIVRPSLWNDTDEVENPEGAHGQTVRSATSVQSTSDFVLRSRDYVFRGDGSRWQVQGPDSEQPLTGFETKGNTAIAGWTAANVVREDESSVAYNMGPTTPDLIALLVGTSVQRPTDFTDAEDIRGPLW